MRAPSRSPTPVFSLVSVLSAEAAHTGVAAVLAAACVLVLLSPKLAIFTLGSPREVQSEAVVGSLIGLIAVVSTLAGILLIRLIVEEGTFDLLVGMGASPAAVGFALSGSLLSVAVWQSIVLALSATAAMTPSWRTRALAAALAVAGLAGPRLIHLRTGPRTRPLKAVLVAAWLAVSVFAAASGWAGGGIHLLLALAATAAWGMLTGILLGARLSVPLALTTALGVWMLWTAAAPLISSTLGVTLSPLASWSIVLERGAPGPGGMLLLAGLAASSWGLAVFAIPSFLGILKGADR